MDVKFRSQESRVAQNRVAKAGQVATGQGDFRMAIGTGRARGS
ncbi:MAG: hypothetical protein ACI87E_003497 [Mariniblastus sp.]|jgi:hypothetical protein